MRQHVTFRGEFQHVQHLSGGCRRCPGFQPGGVQEGATVLVVHVAVQVEAYVRCEPLAVPLAPLAAAQVVVPQAELEFDADIILIIRLVDLSPTVFDMRRRTPDKHSFPLSARSPISAV